MKRCSECDSPAHAKGLCNRHYLRKWRKGSTALDVLAPLADRLRAGVDVGTPDECWEWTKARHPQGHGQLASGIRPRHIVYAHRVAWELANGRALKRGEVVRHRCDNPPCCNPAHLLVGTQADNVADMIERGRAWWQITTHVDRGLSSAP